jgi:hypothetical protein
MVPVHCKIWVLMQDTLSVVWSDEWRIISKFIAVLVLQFHLTVSSADLHVDVTVAEEHEEA